MAESSLGSRAGRAQPAAEALRRGRAGALRTLALGAGQALLGCLYGSAPNAQYTATTAELAAARARMSAHPVVLPRPVIVLSGWHAPAYTGSALLRALQTLTGAEPGRVRLLAYPFARSIEDPAQRAVAFVERHYPCADPERTTEVDVVGISMGGLVARTAAADPALRGEPGAKRLRIHTLYTLASPHRGARLARRLAPDPAARAMRPGSEFLARLDAALPGADYPIVPYAILRDGLVGATHTAPAGQHPIWVPGPLAFAHFTVALDPRVQTDLALRLRGDPPLGHPSAPPRD